MNKAELRQRRAALGLSQQALAERLGVTRQAVYLWERGERMWAAGMLDLALCWLEYEQAQERAVIEGSAILAEAFGHE